MKDVLLIADLHGQFGKIDSFLELNPEAVFIAGDITNMGPVDTVDDVLSRIDVPCFAVPGNCDPREILDTLEHSDAVCLHGARINLGTMTIVGIGGSNPTPFNTPFELTDKQIDDLLHQGMAKMEKTVHNVLVSHAPPFETLDLINGEHVGSQSIRRHIKDFDLVCCAHIHEQRGVKEVDGVKIVNPGPAMDGYCAMLHFGNEAKDIRVELLTV
jgi:hypothetical protein